MSQAKQNEGKISTENRSEVTELRFSESELPSRAAFQTESCNSAVFLQRHSYTGRRIEATQRNRLFEKRQKICKCFHVKCPPSLRWLNLVRGLAACEHKSHVKISIKRYMNKMAGRKRFNDLFLVAEG